MEEDKKKVISIEKLLEHSKESDYPSMEIELPRWYKKKIVKIGSAVVIGALSLFGLYSLLKGPSEKIVYLKPEKEIVEVTRPEKIDYKTEEPETIESKVEEAKVDLVSRNLVPSLYDNVYRSNSIDIVCGDSEDLYIRKGETTLKYFNNNLETLISDNIGVLIGRDKKGSFYYYNVQNVSRWPEEYPDWVFKINKVNKDGEAHEITLLNSDFSNTIKAVSKDIYGNLYVVIEDPPDHWSSDHYFNKYSNEGEIIYKNERHPSLERRGDSTPIIATFDGKKVYILMKELGEVVILNDKLEEIDSFGKKGSNPGEFTLPEDIVVDNKGRVYVADTGNHRIQIFDGDGKFITMFGKYGGGPGEFDNPTKIAVDNFSNIYVLDSGNKRIQHFKLK